MAKKNKKEPELEPTKTKKSKGGAKEFVVDFSQEKEGGGGGKWIRRVPEGVYFPFTVKEAKVTKSSNDNDMLEVIFIGKEGKVRARQTRDRFVFLPQSLFKLRQLLEAAGLDVPKKKIKIPYDKLIGADVGISFLDDEYNDKITSKPDEYCDVDECDAGSEDDEDKKSKKSGKKKGKKKDDSLEDLDLESI